VLITEGATFLAFVPLAKQAAGWEPLCYARIGGLAIAKVITLPRMARARDHPRPTGGACGSVRKARTGHAGRILGGFEKRSEGGGARTHDLGIKSRSSRVSP
jgi:hypothetical protein